MEILENEVKKQERELYTLNRQRREAIELAALCRDIKNGLLKTPHISPERAKELLEGERHADYLLDKPGLEQMIQYFTDKINALSPQVQQLKDVIEHHGRKDGVMVA